MSEHDDPKKRSTDLRERAEALLSQRISRLDGTSAPPDIQRLVHELEVHQIELQMQNEELRKSEKLLSDARDRYSDLYDCAPAGYFTLDRAGVILEANLTGAELLAYDRQFLIGKPFQMHLAEEYADAFHLHKEDAFTTGVKQRCEVKLRKSDGSSFDAQLESRAIDSDRQLGRCHTIVSDISDRKHAEEQLRESEERYRQMFEENRAVKLLVDPESSDIVDANQAAAEFYGYELDRLKQLKISDISEPSPEDISRSLAKAYSEKDSYSQFLQTLASGELRHVEVYSSPISLRGKTLLYSIIHDITDRHRAQENLARSNHDLERFAYVASHDLQEPLRNVTSCLQLLERRYKEKLGPDAQQLIQYAVDSAERMKRLMTDLLRYSRVTTQGKALHEVDSEKVLIESLLNLDSSIKDSRALVTHDELPRIEADGTQLLQVFQNLIGNAIKFRGEEPPRIHISAYADNDEWVFVVKDNSIGIDSKHFSKIFMVFQQLDKQEKSRGTGIGLAIVKKIIERHGGRIWVESEVGAGSTFYFTIRIRKVAKP